MSKKRFYCHGNLQDFTIYNHKTLVRSFYFGRCSECKNYFWFDTFNNEIKQGREAEKKYKELKKDIVIHKPELKYTKSLSYAVPARKTICSGSKEKDTYNKKSIEYQIMNYLQGHSLCSTHPFLQRYR